MGKQFDIIRHIRKNELGATIAKACKIKRQAVWQWRKVPPRRVLKVSAVTGIPPHRIRPDIFAP